MEDCIMHHTKTTNHPSKLVVSSLRLYNLEVSLKAGKLTC